MATLPVYRNQAGVTRLNGLSVGGVERAPNTDIGQSLSNVGRAIQDVAALWQKTQDAAETLDAETKLKKAVAKIQADSAEWGGYNTQGDISKQKKEKEKNLDKAWNDSFKSFTNPKALNDFRNNTRLFIDDQKIQLAAAFRKKTIDLATSRLAENEAIDKESYVSTGNKEYKDIYRGQLKKFYEAGYTTRDGYTKALLSVDEWDKDYYMARAFSDPDGFAQEMKEGKIQTDKETLSALSSAVSKAKRLQELQKDAEQYAATQAVMDQINYDDVTGSLKLLEDNKAKLSKNVYESARKAVLSKNGIDAQTQADTMAEILMEIEALPNEEGKIREFYKGTNDILARIDDSFSKGLLNPTDRRSLQNTVYKKQGKNIDILKSDDEGKHWYINDFTNKEAWEHIEANYTGGNKNQLFIEYFRQTNDTDYDKEQRKEILKTLINADLNKAINRAKKRQNGLAEGRIIENDKGERMIFRGGQWQKM